MPRKWTNYTNSGDYVCHHPFPPCKPLLLFVYHSARLMHHTNMTWLYLVVDSLCL